LGIAAGTKMLFFSFYECDFMIRFFQLIGGLFRLAVRERLTEVAAALSFQTLLTLVPLVGLTFAAAARLPEFSDLIGRLDRFVIYNLLPGKSVGIVAQQIQELAKNAQSLAWPGLLMLLVLVFMTLRTVETVLNRLWNVSAGRRWQRRVPLYLAGLLLLPLLMGALTNLSGFLIDLALGWHTALASFRRVAFMIVSPLILSGCFALLFYAMPNAKVPPRAALWGGLLAGVGLFILKTGFRLYLDYATFYSMVYGALSALPIFLLWLYLAWSLVLGSAALSAVLGRSQRPS
jgi:membrane protein